MRTLIEKNVSGTGILLLFLITNLVYGIMLFITIPKVMSFSGGMKLFDLSPFGYSVEYADALLRSLGMEGRSAYLYAQLPFDMIYPFLFGVTYCLMIAYFLNKLEALKGPLFYLCCLPVGAGIFDYLENIGIITMLRGYPNNPDYLILTTSSFTIIKSMLSAAGFMVLIIAWLIFSAKKLLRMNDS